MRKEKKTFRQAGLARRDLLRVSPLMLLQSGETAAQTGDEDSVHDTADRGPDIVLENREFRLIIGANGKARSLVEKSTSQECLTPGSQSPICSITQYAPFDGQLILLYPADAKTFAARSVRREGDRLVVEFEGIPHRIAIRLKIAPHYIAFTVEQVQTEGKGWEESDRLKTPIDELVFLELPLRERERFGSWLNVMWDDGVAINLLAADPWCRITSQSREACRLVRASSEERVKTTGVTAALIATRTATLLDRVAEVENDFNLPRGVEMRRRKEYRYSYYWAAGVTPETIERHIQYARTSGFPMMMVSYRDFSRSAGHFPWRPEYPRGMDDLRDVVQRIKSAGLIPGLHVHYCKAEKTDPYVSGKPDNRLNMARIFTLAAPLDETALTIQIEENPAGSTLQDNRRLLKIGGEIIAYENFTTSPPYRFTGCRRAQLGTQAASQQAGIMFGLLDVDTWPIFIRFNQNTTIQQEVASRIAGLYDAGFEFLYLDGAEDVHAPFWFTTAWAQWVVYQSLKRPLLLAEGAQRDHFNWHITSRSNAYDVQQPEAMKASMRLYQEAQAPRTANDFTAINFGWMGYRAPDTVSIGTQPDMVEYVVSRAAGWDCPFSFNPHLAALDAHARTPDNLAIMKRWQNSAFRNGLSPSQKEALRNPKHQHTLIVDEAGAFELAAYEQIPNVAGADGLVRAFVFERRGRIWVVYWHTFGQCTIELPRPAAGLRLWEEIGRKETVLTSRSSGALLPVSGRRYLECADLTKTEAIRIFQQGRIVGG